MAERLLEVAGLTASYGDIQALFGIDMRLDAGETVAVIGANGAGKTTCLRAVTGLLRAAPEAIRLDGRPIGGMAPNAVVALGIAMVPEGRRLFPSLSVEENILLGGYSRRRGPWHLERLHRLFPVLKERARQPATSLSGGQQQMVAIARALMANPRVLLCDEVSLGLAPIVIQDIYAVLPQIRAEGTAIVVVEQDINQALAAADRVYCLQEGRVVLAGPPRDLTREAIAAAYFGVRTPA